MTVDLSLIGERLRRLDECLKILRQIARLTYDEFINDPVRIGGTERYLQVAIEVCLDIANHIIASEGLRAPRDYADAFAVLVEANLIPGDFLQTLQRMARFRNRLVHLYWDIDAATIYEIIQYRLSDFEHFKRYILDFLSYQGSMDKK